MTVLQNSAIDAVKSYLLQLQNSLCNHLESLDPHSHFIKDSWTRPQGGGGTSCVLEDGAVIERAGINFSHVFGTNMPNSATAHRPQLAGGQFQALGLSVVIHPRNPYAPTTHANLRLFIATKEGASPIWWFGGGFDLTPYYGFEEDCIHWHQTAKAACEPFGAELYPHYKTWCDQYFYLKHRNEPRGIGGLFFDDVNQWEFDRCFAFIQSIGDHFLKAYMPILTRRISILYTERQRNFQLYRRGRYVEFNLIYDRGTLFGLQSGGRTESILISLPPIVHWQYDYQPEIGSEEEKLYSYYLAKKQWV